MCETLCNQKNTIISIYMLHTLHIRIHYNICGYFLGFFVHREGLIHSCCSPGISVDVRTHEVYCMCETLCNQKNTIISIYMFHAYATYYNALYIIEYIIIYVDIFGLPGVDTRTVNFILRSTLHNIDFGLVVDGVTFYDCSVRDK